MIIFHFGGRLLFDQFESFERAGKKAKNGLRLAFSRNCGLGRKRLLSCENAPVWEGGKSKKMKMKSEH